MDTLRKPFFFVAVALIVIVVLIEIGGPLIVPVNKTIDREAITQLFEPRSDLDQEYNNLGEDQKAEVDSLGSGSKPPGVGILYMALVDGVVLFTIALMAISLLIPDAVQGRLQGCATLIFGLLLILGSCGLCFLTLQLVILMVSLLLSFPFGTIAYMVIYGHFDRTTAGVILGLLMALKIGFVVCLLLAQQRFIQNKGLVLLIVTSLLANVVLSFLHGFVPGFLVSITDGIGGIIMAILAIIWAALLLVGAVIAVVRAITP